MTAGGNSAGVARSGAAGSDPADPHPAGSAGPGPRPAEFGSARPGGARPGGARPGGARSGADRDRDAAGRARNARPRDEFGRPLPREAAGAVPAPDEQALEPAAALALAQQLIDSGRAFRAHEVLEASWKAAPPAERELWRGLVQVAVGITHAQRGNARGAAALLGRGGRRVAGYADDAPYGVAAAAVARCAADLAALIESEGLGSVPPSALRVTLRADPASQETN
jgi:uncharacterized protein